MDEKPFLPLGAKHIETPRQTTPVNWFERIAPQLSEAAPVVPVEPIAPTTLGGEAVRAAAFADVALVARRESAARNAPPVEPPEVVAMRQAARAEAELLLRSARVQAEAISARAQSEGYAAGYEKGMEEGRREATRIVMQQHADDRAEWRDDLTAFVARIEAERQRSWAEMEPQITSLVFALAQKVIKMEVEASRDVALAVVQHALRRVSDSGSLRVRVSPIDLETVRAHREDLIDLVDGLRHIEVVDDRRIGPGGCIIETNSGNIDARIETQLEETARMMDLPQE